MAKRTCSIDGCGGRHEAKGLCGKHYTRLRRNGDPNDYGAFIVGDFEKRFWAKVEKTEDCWLWTSATQPAGYGMFRMEREKPPALAHRIAYELVRGPIPEGLVIDHLCRVRLCVNPDHLEVVTERENILRGEGASAKNARKTHCPAGHPYAGDNLIVDRDGWRRCRICKRAKDARWRRSR